MRSTCVAVKSGNTCFKFDKSHWDGYWETHWNSSYGNKDTSKQYLIPWQIIPIKTDIPIKIDTTGYNVVTYIRTSNIPSMEQKIKSLMNSSQFLLFLKAKNIHISFVSNGHIKSSITKSTQNEEVLLFSNGQEECRWLIYTNEEVKVPVELRDSINADINTPQKLKLATSFDLSFAIAIGQDGKLKRLPQKDAVIYTYLPTSFKFGRDGFPFLVNANFITDAGRLQLHKDSEWNKLIFSKIPSEFLTWIKELSTSYWNYYDILPKKNYGRTNALEKVYAKEMEKAIETIAFIPRLCNTKDKVLSSSAIMDRIGFLDAIEPNKLLEHLNREYNRNSCVDDFISPVRNYRLFSDYGVFILDKDKIKKILEDEQLFSEMTVDYNIKLITFFHNYIKQNPEESDEINNVLSTTKFLLDENMELKRPNELFFHTDYKKENSLAQDVVLLNEEVSEAIGDLNLTAWLSKLGVQLLSNISFVEYLYENKDYITTGNAIEVGKFIFRIYQTEDLFGEISEYKLRYIRFISTKGTLLSADDLYLSTIYKPELNLEPVLDEDVFISDKYCEGDSVAEWKVFLLKMGVKESISKETKVVQLYGDDYDSRFDKPFFEKVKMTSQKYGWISYNGWALHNGWRFFASTIHYKTFSFLNNCDKYNFSKLVFSKIMSVYTIEELDTEVQYVGGVTGFIGRNIFQSMLTDLDCNINHFKWVIDNCSIIPTVKKDCRKASNVYSNSIHQISEFAGNYLPIIDVDEEISGEWQNYLGLKNSLTLDDYLFILTEIANDPDNVADNQTKISLVYQKMVDFGCLKSENYRKQIQEWASLNKILSKDNTFQNPSELSYITLDGFSSTNRVYIGTVSDRTGVIDLLSLMGVSIITENSITPDYVEKKETDELKKILRGKLSPLALVASGEQADKESYLKHKSIIAELLDNTHFYHCKTINLTYGSDSDVISKTTFSSKNEFYYTGSLRPASIESLLTPLCKYLDIKEKERELFIILIENQDGICQNLEDKGYNVELLEKEFVVESGTTQIHFTYKPSETEQERNLITGFKGEIIVYEKLKGLGYDVECPSISTEHDYDKKIVLNGKAYFCKINYEKYDLSFTTNSGVRVYVEVKSTTSRKEMQTNMPISYNELSMIEQCASCSRERYFLIRVFGIEQETQDIYLFDGRMFNDESLMNIL